MIKELKNIKEYTYEDNNSFNKSTYPCFYLKKEFGYVVFFILSEESIDYAIFDSKKNLILLIDNISLTIKDDREINWIQKFLTDNLDTLINGFKISNSTLLD